MSFLPLVFFLMLVVLIENAAICERNISFDLIADISDHDLLFNNCSINNDSSESLLAIVNYTKKRVTTTFLEHFTGIDCRSLFHLAMISVQNYLNGRMKPD